MVSIDSGGGADKCHATHSMYRRCDGIVTISTGMAIFAHTASSASTGDGYALIQAYPMTRIQAAMERPCSQTARMKRPRTPTSGTTTKERVADRDTRMTLTTVECVGGPTYQIASQNDCSASLSCFTVKQHGRSLCFLRRRLLLLLLLLR